MKIIVFGDVRFTSNYEEPAVYITPLSFYPVDGENNFFRSARNFLPGYTKSQPGTY
jgi:hypothetical protein